MSATSGNCVPGWKTPTTSFTDDEKPNRKRELLLDNAGRLRNIVEDYRQKRRYGRIVLLDDSDDEDSDDVEVE